VPASVDYDDGEIDEMIWQRKLKYSDPEDEHGMFIRNVGCISENYMALYIPEDGILRGKYLLGLMKGFE
jgi:hypothetical protein